MRGTRIAVEYPLVGRFNVENVMTAFGCALALGIPTQIIAEALATMPAVPGRLERVRPAVDAPVSVYVDYAHTPDALTKAIASIKELSGGRTIGRLLAAAATATPPSAPSWELRRWPPTTPW